MKNDLFEEHYPYARRAAILPLKLQDQINVLKRELVDLYGKESKILKILHKRDQDLENALATQSKSENSIKEIKNAVLELNNQLKKCHVDKIEILKTTEDEKVRYSDMIESLRRESLQLQDRVRAAEVSKAHVVSGFEMRLEQMVRMNEELLARYTALSKSKLGRIQVSYWRKRAGK